LEIDLNDPQAALRGRPRSPTPDAPRVSPGLYGQTLRQPAGVAGIIVPWNSPVFWWCVRSAALGDATSAVKMPGQTALVNGMFAQLLADTAACLPAW